MQANEFDELIRKRFDDEEIPYQPMMWQQLSQQLPAAKEKKNRIGMFWWQASGIAAAIALAVISIIHWQQPVEEKVTATMQTPFKKNNTEKPWQEPESTAVPEKLKEVANAERSHNMVASKNKKKFITRKVTEEYNSNMPPVSTIAQEEEVIAAGNEQHGLSDTMGEPKEELMAAEKKKKSSAINIYEPLELTVPEKIGDKTSFSFTGGVNYGSQNTGYMVGVTAQRSISRKLYLEGNFGVVNGNTEAFSTFKTGGRPSAGTSGSPFNIQSVSEESLTTTVTPLSLYYFQVAPVVGYNLYKGISVGVGADLQTLLLNDGANLVKSAAGDNQHISRLDVGVTGKTEYQISKRIKAGVLYRNGVNNLLKSKMYLDRDYLQVQLKYTFIH